MALLLGTHALCLLSGGIFLYFRPPLGTAPAASAERQAEAPIVIRDPISAESAAMATQAIAYARGAPTGYDPVEALRLANQMAPGEGEKQVRALTEDGVLGIPPGAKSAAAYLAWFRENPEAALHLYLGTNHVRKELLAQALEQIPLQEHIALAKKFPLFYRGLSRLYELLAPRLAALDAKEAAALIQGNFSTSTPGDPIRDVVRAWPSDDFDGLADLAIAAKDPALVMLVLEDEKNGRKAYQLFRLLKSRGYLPALSEKGPYTEHGLRRRLCLHAGPEMPLDERIAERGWAWGLSKPSAVNREAALGLFALCDVHNSMNSGHDLRHAFRHGVMTAEQVLAAVETALPELTAAAAREVRLNVFRVLAWENPLAASSLLASLPEKERKPALLNYSTSDFIEGNPADFHAIVALAPGPDSPEETQARTAAWEEFSKGAYRKSADDYIEWVRHLPHGPNRDAARATLVQRIKHSPHLYLVEEFQKP
ncbi:hypothetical protein [Luteolibacter sp. Populi]|uniref:hypothetical protein n=1 Tax=Luteolibacter sp. Populi TaxID=3230487 RepID=UPI0034664BDA